MAVGIWEKAREEGHGCANLAKFKRYSPKERASMNKTCAIKHEALNQSKKKNIIVKW